MTHDHPPPPGESEQAAPGPDAPERRNHPKRRIPLLPLLSVALLLGVAAGGTAGYKVQADREPAKLPPLSVAALERPALDGPAERKLPASRDRAALTEGDLRKLLVERPSGATGIPASDVNEDGWSGLVESTDWLEDPAALFAEYQAFEFRRAATVSWLESDETLVQVQLIQFHGAQGDGAGDFVYANTSGTTDLGLPGTEWVDHWKEPDVTTTVVAARRGDIALVTYVAGLGDSNEKRARELAKRQLERL